MSAPIKRERRERFEDKIADGEGFLKELEQRMCDGETLRTICQSMDIPSDSVMQWFVADVRRYERYQRALEMSGLMEGDQAKDLALASGDVKIAVDTLKWRATKLARPVYGDRQDVNVNHAVKVEIVAFTEADVLRVASQRAPRLIENDSLESQEVPSVGTQA